MIIIQTVWVSGSKANIHLEKQGQSHKATKHGFISCFLLFSIINLTA